MADVTKKALVTIPQGEEWPIPLQGVPKEEIAFSVLDIVELAAATSVGGPVGGSFVLAAKALGVTDFAKGVEVVANLTTAMRNFVELTNSTDIPWGERIAAALGYPIEAVDGKQADGHTPILKSNGIPVSAIVDILEKCFIEPASTDPKTHQETPAAPYMATLNKHVTPAKYTALTIEVLDYPKNVFSRASGPYGTKFVLNLATVTWLTADKRQYGQQFFLQGLKQLFVAPIPEVTLYDIYRYPGVITKETKTTLTIPRIM